MRRKLHNFQVWLVELINISAAELKFYDCSIEKMIKIRTPFDKMIKLDSKVLS